MVKIEVTVKQKDDETQLAGCLGYCGCAAVAVMVLGAVGTWWTWAWESNVRWWCLGTSVATLLLVLIVSGIVWLFAMMAT